MRLRGFQRKIFLFILVICFSTAAHSQVLISILFGDKLNTDKLEFGLMVSPTLCNLTKMEANYRFGLGLALYFNWKISDKWYFHPEAIPKAAMGAKDIKPYPTGDASLDELFAGGSVERNIKTIALPLLIRYRIDGLWFAETGPQIDWMLTTTDVFKTSVNNDPVTFEKKINSQISNFDVGWATGLVYKFSQKISMAIGVRYFYGFTDVVKTTAGTQHNSAWTFNVYIPIGAAKAQAKREKAATPQP